MTYRIRPPIVDLPASTCPIKITFICSLPKNSVNVSWSTASSSASSAPPPAASAATAVAFLGADDDVFWTGVLVLGVGGANVGTGVGAAGDAARSTTADLFDTATVGRGALISGLGAAAARVGGVSTVLLRTVAGGGALKSIPDDEGGAGAAAGAGGGIHEGTKAFALALGTKAPVFGFSERPASFVVGGVVVLSLSWSLIVAMCRVSVLVNECLLNGCVCKFRERGAKVRKEGRKAGRKARRGAQARRVGEKKK